MHHLAIILLLLLPLGMRAQVLSEAQLDTATVFRSINEALKNPDEVYVLQLKVKRGEIPPEIYQLSNLHVLELKRGKITALPNDFSRLDNLVKLDLTRNELNHFPPVLFNMPQLRELRIGKNKITRVPEEITAMKKLEILDLWSNPVPRLPLAIAKMKSLEVVDMRMIEISQEDQDYLKELMPDVQFYFSVPCNCR